MASLSREQLNITPALVIEATSTFLSQQAQGDITRGQKTITYLNPNFLWNDPTYAHLKEKYKDKSLEYRHTALIGGDSTYTGVKDLFSNPLNIDLGGQRQNTVVKVRKITSGEFIGEVDGTDISDARTALYAHWTLQYCFAGANDIKVFMFGAGPVAQQIVKFLEHSAGDRIASLTVSSRGPTADKLALDYSGSTSFPITAVHDKQGLKEADFVISVTTATEVLFGIEDVNLDAVFLSLGGKDMTEDLAAKILHEGETLCDDIRLVNERKTKAAWRYLQRRETDLVREAEAGTYKIRNFCHATPLDRENKKGLVQVLCSGYAALDIMVAGHCLRAAGY